ncbi:MAG TPA: formate dehydrogenase accessory protein FdhE [Vicinamibacterales bacterium]|nr:formate dehydrogenase accessory protein FdhE [Vicinamibacterales bacterium]
MSTAASALDTLKQGRPEWTPWLAVVAEICEQANDPVWDAAAQSCAPASGPAVPLLANASVAVPRNVLGRSLTRLIQKASRSGSGTMATLDRVLNDEPGALALFAASVSQDSDVVKETAARRGIDADSLQAVSALWGIPFLQACHRQWAAVIPKTWAAPYCPICASRPAFVEVRGIERARHARCGRCGAEWYARMLQCSYCDNSDHEQLLTLVPQSGAPTQAIEACTKCRGYLKAFTRLQGCSPGSVYLEDLASVDLDIAALDAGYRRPQGAGYPLAVTVTAHAARRRLFAWNT